MRRSLSTICGVVIFSAAILAQSGGTVSDPISGTWTGSVGPGTAPSYSITMSLKFDGSNKSVAGSAQGAEAGDTAVVKSGTFDPQTGALKLEMVRTNASALALFEGTVVQGTVTGRLSISNQPGPGTFILTRRDTSSAVVPAAQAGAPDASVALQKGFAELSGWILKAAELVPAEKYTYQPVKTVRTFGQLIAHIADGHNYECGRAAGRSVQWSDAIEKGRTDKATLLPKLKQSIDACAAVYGAAPIPPPTLANVAHSSLHYGNVVTYMRMLGLTPPSS